MNSQFLVNVPDPSDFPLPTEAPGLRELDTSLRCSICHELYDGPVSLNCGHSFCSCCIRVSIAVKQECPTCRKTAIEGHIKSNVVVEDAVHSWKLSRPYILGVIKALNEQKNMECEHGSSLATPKAKKRKLVTVTERNNEASSSTGSGSLGSPLKPKRVKQSSSDMSGTIPTSDIEEDELPDLSRAKNGSIHDDFVDCPLCSKRVMFKHINQHMDSGCKDSPPLSTSARSAAADWKKLMGRSSKGKQRDDDDDGHPLPKASYSTLKDRQLKEMLIEYGLPTTGDRNQWMQRHQRWVITYNANLDKSSKYRKSKEELKRELKKWEEEKSKKKKTTVEDTVAHEKRHKSEFARLVEAARPRKVESASTIGKSDASHLSINPPSGKQYTKMLGGLGAEENAIVVDSEEEELSPIQKA